MPWNNQAVTLFIIDAQVSGYSGLFVYSPSPGAGHLIASIVAAAQEDPYGNAAEPIIRAYGSDGSSVGLTDGPPAALIINTGNAAESGNGVILASTVGSGTAQQLGVYGQSPTFGTGLDAGSYGAFEVYSASEDGTQLATASMVGKDGAKYSGISFNAGNAAGTLASYWQVETDEALWLFTNNGQLVAGVPMLAVHPGTTTPEGWQSLGALTGTGSANLTVNAGRYRNTLEGETEIDIWLTATGTTTAGTAIPFANTMPAAYQFTGGTRSYPVGYNGTVTTATNTATMRVMGTTAGNPGAVELELPSLPANTNITITQRIPRN